ncbi:MAG: hypothetical protein IT379_21860 [Deltaproteobacteria bacterium]|nr:hypothetical protein [Deltaproteobacteria bacterium]
MTPRVGILLAGLAGMIGCSDESSPARDAAARGDAAGMDGAGMDAALDCRLVCDDRIDCTDDSCAADACLHRPTAAACPAGSSCDPRMGCTAGRPCAADPDCRDEDPCTTNERCDWSTRVCVFGILDGDGDGFGPPVCGGADCDDNNAGLRPGGPESCNGLDDNCNDVVDEDTGMVCGEGESCVRGECVCGPGFTECFGHCVDLQTDGYHCGDCGASCGAGTCTAGVCVCGAGQTMCSFGCADLETSSASCGACGRRCPAGVDCVGGECQCPAGMSPCGGGCVDLESDLFNCGFCGRGCRDFRPSEECRGGECVVCGEPGTPCCRPSFIERAECRGSACAADGICAPCGDLGQLCCGTTRYCAEGTCGADGRCSSEVPDAGADGGPDAGAPSCSSGAPCADGLGCGTGPGYLCVEEQTGPVTVDGHSWTQEAWIDGYCVEHLGARGTAGTCEPVTNAGCPACARCVHIADDRITGEPLFGCLESCAITGSSWMTDNGGCREGYACDLGEQVCIAGCSTDEDCRVSLVDGVTRYDSTSSAVCDRSTYLCRGRPFTASASAGSPCAADRDCEDDGYCIPASTAWPNGYCSKRGCRLSGRTCAGSDSVCLDDEIESLNGTCLNACTVGDDADPFMPDSDCPTGTFRCVASDGGPVGGCIPGNYNPIRTSNFGFTCTRDTDCYSPYGGGRCMTFNGQGICTFLGCNWTGYAREAELGFAGAPDSAVCAGEGSLCAPTVGGEGMCLDTCDTSLPPGGSGCLPVMACLPAGTGTLGYCYPACRNEADCGGRSCDWASGRCS